MIIKLNLDGTITIKPMKVPENLESVRISYVFPKGLDYLQPMLVWGGEVFEGNNLRISKKPPYFDMVVHLFNANGEHVREYVLKETPDLYIGYGIKTLSPDIIAYIQELEKENKDLKEKGDLI